MKYTQLKLLLYFAELEETLALGLGYEWDDKSVPQHPHHYHPFELERGFLRNSLFLLIPWVGLSLLMAVVVGIELVVADFPELVVVGKQNLPQTIFFQIYENL